VRSDKVQGPTHSIFNKSWERDFNGTAPQRYNKSSKS